MSQGRFSTLFRVIAVIVVSCTFLAGSLFASPVALVTLNPGFEQGKSPWQESLGCDGWDCSISGDIIPFGGAGNHVYFLNHWAGCGPGCGSDFHYDRIFQTGIVMPSDDDVRWNFWVEPFGSFTSPQYFDSAPFVGKVGTQFDQFGVCLANCLSFQVQLVGGAYQYSFGPNQWGSVELLSKGYYVTSDNLRNYFSPGDVVGVSYETSGIWSTDGFHQYYRDMSAFVDDKPVPEAGTATLLVAGILLVRTLGLKFVRSNG